jgi:hypothetical protein
MCNWLKKNLKKTTLTLIAKKNNVNLFLISAQNTAAHLAALNDQLEVLRMLATHNFNFRAGEDLKNA